MTTRTVDPIELFARLNPVPPERLVDSVGRPERETTFARIAARRAATPARTRRLPARRLVMATVVALALAIPAVAFSGVAGGLFGFSNHGTPVGRDALSSVTGLDLSRAKRGSVVRLAARSGVGIYAAKTRAGDLCYFVGPKDRSKLRTEGLGGGCMNAAASARFPSDAQPVVDLSLYALAPGAVGPTIQRLAGVAADGVASVQLLALADCHVVATAPVIDNVYLADDLPIVPEAQIVARGRDGDAVWHEAVTPASNPDATSCGLG
jgi:hypothetical protein